MVKKLLAAGADVRVTTKDGSTPLHVAVRSATNGYAGTDGNLLWSQQVVKMLLAAGAAVSAKNNDG